MLIIRDKQMKVFKIAARRNFENNLIDHLQDFAPNHAASLKPEGLRSVIQFGMKRSRTYRFSLGGPIRFYIEMMFMMGSFFDTDCQIPWAGDILADPETPDQMERADRLYDKAMDYVAQAGGQGRKNALVSLKRTRQQSYEEVIQLQGELIPAMIIRLKGNWPEKCHYIGDEALTELVRKGQKKAREYGFQSNGGTAVFTEFMFQSGHGFDTDPLFPWVSKLLADPNITDPNQKLERLYSKGMAYIEGVLKFIETNGR